MKSFAALHSAVALAILALTASARPQCGDPDLGFGAAGADGAVTEFVLFDDGSGPALYAAGGFGALGGTCASGVASWNGSSWSPVGAGIQGTVVDLAVLDTGAGPRLHALVRPEPWVGAHVALWNGTGWVQATSTLGSSFGVQALGSCVVAGTPQIVVGGRAPTIEGSMVPMLQRWTGTSWASIPGAPATSIGPWGDPNTGWIESLATYDDGSGVKLYVAGNFDRFGSDEWCPGLVRWDGTTWERFTPTTGSWANGAFQIAVHDDGSGEKLYLSAILAGTPCAAWNGSTLVAVGSGMSGAVEQFCSTSSSVLGRPAGLWALGRGPTQERGLFHWDGAAWTFSALPTLAPSTYTFDLGVFDDGSGAEMFVGGDFLFTTPQRVQNIARWNGTSYEPIASSAATAVLAHPGSSGANRVEGLGIHDFGSGPAVVAGGTFQRAGDATAARIARFDGTSWNSLTGELLSSSVPRKFLTFGGALWVAGELYPGGSGLEPFLRWNGAGYYQPNVSDGIGRGLATLDTGSGPVLFGLTERSLRRWNGTQMLELEFFVGSVDLRALVAFDDGSGPALYVGGTFASLGGVATSGIARFDGSTWSAVGAGLAGTVEVLEVHDDGVGPRLIAGGTFTSSGGVPLANVARWNGANWTALGSGIGGTVLALASVDDGEGDGRVLVAGGAFATAGGVPAANIARWNGTSWSEAFGGSQGPKPTVRALLGVDHDAHGGRALYIGGDFSGIGGVPSTRFARIDLCPELGETFCHGDGSEGPCPCANESTVGDRAGCRNSLGTAGTLRARGRASLAADSLALDGAGMPNSSVLYFQAGSRHAATAFGDGLKCTGGPFVRLGTKDNSGGASSYPLGGDPSISVRGFVVAAGTRHYQARYRNSATFCGPDTFNYTNAVTILWSL